MRNTRTEGAGPGSQWRPGEASCRRQVTREPPPSPNSKPCVLAGFRISRAPGEILSDTLGRTGQSCPWKDETGIPEGRWGLDGGRGGGRGRAEQARGPCRWPGSLCPCDPAGTRPKTAGPARPQAQHPPGNRRLFSPHRFWGALSRQEPRATANCTKDTPKPAWKTSTSDRASCVQL